MEDATDMSAFVFCRSIFNYSENSETIQNNERKLIDAYSFTQSIIMKKNEEITQLTQMLEDKLSNQ